MAYVTTISLSDVLRSWVSRVLTTIASAYETYVDLRSRRHAIEVLESLSDSELADRGLTRSEIVPFVFRDRMTF